MPALSWRRLLLAAAGGLGFAAASPALGETLSVNVDQARIVRLPDRVSTIVIGNPLIADATLQGGGILVVTGKGYGSTNMLALDRNGRVVMDNTVQVTGPAKGDLIVVYKGVDRESYSCAPDCQPRITLGDSAPYFTNTLQQTGVRNGQAQASAPAR